MKRGERTKVRTESTQHQPDPHRDETDNHERHISGSVNVRGEIEAKRPPDLTEEHNAERKEDNARDQKKYVVEFLTLIALGIYTLVTGYQACLTREALVSVQRAFVIPMRPKVDAIPETKTGARVAVQVTMGWENEGNTPATNVAQHLSMSPRNDPIPKDFDFPDIWSPWDDHETPKIYIGPKGTTIGGSFLLYMPMLKEVQDGHRHVYFWGWAKYNDAFSIEHITEFCAEFKVNGPQFNLNDGFPFNFDQCNRHNCTDKDCEIKH